MQQKLWKSMIHLRNSIIQLYSFVTNFSKSVNGNLQLIFQAPKINHGAPKIGYVAP